MARILAIDETGCIGCAVCADALPAVFMMDNRGFARVKEPGEAPSEEIQEIIDICPGGCIRWEE